MPDIKCDWDFCKHYNLKTEYCNNPDEVELSTMESEPDEDGNKLELLYCKSFVSYEEGDST